jgi:diguanylate cyclase (GGDEF)-like protein
MSAIPLTGSLMGACLAKREIVWKPDLKRVSAHIPLNQEPAEYNVMCAPVMLVGKAIAVVRLANIDPNSTDCAWQGLKTVMPLLCSSLERLLFHDQIDRVKRGMESSFRIARLLEDTLGEKDILRKVCDEVPKLLPCAGCVIMVRDEQGLFRPGVMYPDKFFVTDNPSSSAIYLRNILEAFPKGACLMPDIRAEKRFSLPDRAIKSMVMAPLRIRGSLRGAIIVFSPADETYDRSHADLLGLAASQTSLTLERAAYFRKQEDMARCDGLTGLLNHRVFQERVREEVERVTRYGRPLSLIMFDIDHFKQFNDTYGHPVGDEVIKMVARTIRGVVRRTDIAFRYGGEEFCVLLPETAAENAMHLAQRLRAKVESNRAVRNLSVTISLGVTGLRGRESAESLVGRADKALYSAKSEGRNRAVLA